jgi:putative oxidoreductase
MKNNKLFDLGILILRIGASAAMMSHGIVKAKYLFSDGEKVFPDPIGIGSLFSLILVTSAELLFAGFVLLGLKIRITSIPIVIAMLVAIFFVHKSDPWAAKELATLYLIVFTSLIFTGSGKYSIDGIIK